MEDLLVDQREGLQRSSFENSIEAVRSTLDLLNKTRAEICEASEPQHLNNAQLQQSLQSKLDVISANLKDVHKLSQGFGKGLDRRFKPKVPSVTEQSDILSDTLVRRAVAMHLLRQGHFRVATAFVDQASPSGQRRERAGLDDMPQLSPNYLKVNFMEMYHILDKLRTERDLGPAKSWATARSQVLQSRGSSLEYKLAQLHFVWLFEGCPQQLLTLRERQMVAMAYAREAFGGLEARHLREIRQLVCAMAFASDISTSPYRQFLENAGAWEEVALLFTREYCSLLGLPADSPLFIAATAGTLALPMVEKLHAIMKEKRTEWTTEHELPVEIPLPLSYRFHPIFVCPVSKEQATKANPPMLLPCGHVIAHESLSRLSKSAKFKCPYCPEESHYNDARKVVL